MRERGGDMNMYDKDFNETRFRNKDFDRMYRRRKTDDISNP